MGKKKLEIERLQYDLDWAMNEIDDLRYKNKKLSNENHSLKMEFNRGLDKIITSERLIIVRNRYIAVECSILFADEMIKTFQRINDTYSKDFQKSVDYWLDVRKELKLIAAK